MPPVPAPVAQSRENLELILDLCRFAEGLVPEAAVRKRWRLEEKDWIALNDDEVVRAVDEERVRRIRSGQTKRELAQLHLVKGPAVLDKILSNEKNSPRHRIDAVKALNDLADFTPQRPGVEQDRVVIHIDLSADTKDPRDVLHIEAAARPVDAEGRVVDAAPQERVPMIAASEQFEQEEIPQKRGPGRPKGSRNKPKVIDEHESRPQCVPGFDV